MGAPIVHIEFKSADFERTAAFYERLFGWKTATNASSSYMKVEGSEGPSAGWIRADLVQSPAPIAYLPVEDLVAKLVEVEAAGGRVLARSLPFAGGGEIALVVDPDGNVIGLWRPKPGGGSSEEPKAAAKPTAVKTPAKPPAKIAIKPKKKK